MRKIKIHRALPNIYYPRELKSHVKNSDFFFLYKVKEEGCSGFSPVFFFLGIYVLATFMVHARNQERISVPISLSCWFFSLASLSSAIFMAVELLCNFLHWAVMPNGAWKLACYLFLVKAADKMKHMHELELHCLELFMSSLLDSLVVRQTEIPESSTQWA